ncbi:uncharacterized protein LOC126820368 [Patella vulgata]|uniref:uncharacterized protein LOC126820368 n=1 Tax=Patella vulgata TaxID=6465 RepID=UPI00217F7DEE|nr:uncharacterized protein LOC126820368 [Patella vulgata]XP_055956795.1 uncharacterized protein LOC126820368 [Patella vulgata]
MPKIKTLKTSKRSTPIRKTKSLMLKDSSKFAENINSPVSPYDEVNSIISPGRCTKSPRTRKNKITLKSNSSNSQKTSVQLNGPGLPEAKTLKRRSTRTKQSNCSQASSNVKLDTANTSRVKSIKTFRGSLRTRNSSTLKSKHLPNAEKEKSLFDEDGPVSGAEVKRSVSPPVNQIGPLVEVYSPICSQVSPLKIAGSSGTKPSLAVQKLFKLIKSKYSTAANKEYAASLKQLMGIEFLGIRSSDRRDMNKKIFEAHPILIHPDIYQLFYLLWQEEERDYQCFVLDYCDKYIKHINHPDWNDQNLQVLKHLIANKSWWETVDQLARVVGILVLSDREKYSQLMDEWISDDNMWIRRTAILHQLNYKHKTDTDRLFRYCLKCANEKDNNYIQKAIGWGLRNYFRIDPELVKRFISKNQLRLTTLSVRFALRYA